jgi:hypothetical protein
LWCTLVLPAMNRDRRSQTSSVTGVARRGSRLIWLGSLVIVGAALLASVWVLRPHPTIDEIESAIKAAGFGPVTPPNRLRGPGSLYVAQGNNFYHQVCRADPSLLEGKVQTSPTLARVRERLEKGGFTWSGDMVEALNGKLDGTRLTSIKYNLADVTIHEVADADLKAIQRKLMDDPHCEAAVQDYSKQQRKVCSGYAALSASTSFRISTESNVEMAVEEAAKLTGVVKRHLEQQIGGQIQIRSTDEYSGDNLYFGILLSDFCPEPDDDRAPRRVAEPKS